MADFLEAVAVAKKAAPTGRFPVSEKTEIIIAVYYVKTYHNKNKQ